MLVFKKIFFLALFFLALLKLSIASGDKINKDSLEKVLIVNSLESIVKADTNIIYDYVDIYELDSIIHGLENIKKIHFKKLFYQGHIREKFPYFDNKIVELKKVSISGKKLKDIPSFIIIDSLNELIIEANNYEIDFDLRKCKKMEVLSLYIKNTYNQLDKICQLEKLNKLVIQEKSNKILKELGCLKKLTNLTSIYLSIRVDHLSDLLTLPNLKELYIANKISYKVVNKNIDYFKKLKKVYFWNFTGTKVEESLLKNELKGIWQ